jgi:hypothetical protein
MCTYLYYAPMCYPLRLSCEATFKQSLLLYPMRYTLRLKPLRSNTHAILLTMCIYLYYAPMCYPLRLSCEATRKSVIPLALYRVPPCPGPVISTGFPV